MLILRRKPGEKIMISGGITVEVIKIEGGAVRIGISAPPEISVDREELATKKQSSPRSLD